MNIGELVAKGGAFFLKKKLSAVQQVFDAAPAGEKAAFQSSVSGAEVVRAGLSADPAAARTAAGVKSGGTEASIAVESSPAPGAVGAPAWDLVVGVGGQSNADGRGVMDALAEPGNHPGVYMYAKTERILLCQEPAGKQGAGWVNNIPSGVTPGDPLHSIVTSAGKEIYRRTRLKPIMVPCAIGSTSLAQWAPPAVEDDETTLFGALCKRVKNVAVPGRPMVFLWFGHEADYSVITDGLSTGTIGTEYIVKWRAHVRNLRARFPDCWIVYCQLATRSSSPTFTYTRQAGESQRLAESQYGRLGAVLGYEATNYSATIYDRYTYFANGTNSATYTGAGSASVLMQGDGTTALGADLCTGLVPGEPYRLSVTIVGTGTVKFQTGSTQVGGSLPAGKHTITGTASAAMLTAFRSTSGMVTNCTVTLDNVEHGYYEGDWRSIMVVTHDVERNASPDDIHLAGPGVRTVGRRAGLAIAERIFGESINGTGPRLSTVTKSGSTVKVKFNRTIQANANGYGASLAASLFRVYLSGVEQTFTACERDPADDTAVRITCSASLAAGTCVVTYGDRAGPATVAIRAGCVYDTDGLPAPQGGPWLAT